MDINDKIKAGLMQSDPAASLKAKFAGKPDQKAGWLSEEKDKKLKETCKDFESVFINMMLQSMRKTLPGDSLFGKSLASDIFQSMFDQNLASQISKNGEGLGVSGMVYRDLKAKITGVHEAPDRPPSRFFREKEEGDVNSDSYESSAGSFNGIQKNSSDDTEPEKEL